jgi:hypothetical protein
MTEDNNSNTKGEKISSHLESCCKTEVNFISNSSDFENHQKDNTRNISFVLNSSNPFQISNPVSLNTTYKEVLLFYNIPADIPVKYSSLLI